MQNSAEGLGLFAVYSGVPSWAWFWSPCTVLPCCGAWQAAGISSAVHLPVALVHGHSMVMIVLIRATCVGSTPLHTIQMCCCNAVNAASVLWNCKLFL